MLQTSPLNKPVLDGIEQPQPGVRPFGRLRRPLAGPEAEPAVADEALSPTEVLPIDSAKTFVGRNGTYYDERWRWMEWRGRNRSWNWAAALTLGGWLAYRRFYVLAGLYLGWLGLLLTMALDGVSLSLLAAVQLGVAVLLGCYANTVYRQRFRNMAWKVAQESKDHAEGLGALADSGGVDRRAVWIMAAAGLGLGGLLIALDG